MGRLSCTADERLRKLLTLTEESFRRLYGLLESVKKN